MLVPGRPEPIIPTGKCGVTMSNYLDYHVHLEQGPYTSAWLEEFLQVARRRGLQEIGFTEHAYRFRAAADILDNDYGRRHATQEIEAYVELILRAKATHPWIKLGLEMDYVPGKEEITRRFLSAYPFDFVLGSVHFLGTWGFDNPEYLEEWKRHQVDEVYRLYFQTLQEAARSGLFDVLAHPDVIKVFGHRPSVKMTSLYEKTVSTIAAAGLAIEVSSAGWRKPVGEQYPAEEFLELALAAGIPITTASDAHRPADVGRDLEKLVSLAKRVGYKTVSSFSWHQRQQLPLP